MSINKIMSVYGKGTPIQTMVGLLNISITMICFI